MEQYVCAGVSLAAVLVWLICKKRGMKRDYDVYFLVVLCAGLCGLFAGMSGAQLSVDADGAIERPQPGEESLRQDYELAVEQLQLQEDYELTVENRHLSEKERAELFAQALEELERDFLGENESLSRITHEVHLTDTVADGRVSVSWSFDRYDAVNLEGKLQEEALDAAGIVVAVTAELTYENEQRVHSFAMHVFPPEKTVTEQLFADLEEQLAAENASEDAYFTLPAQAGGYDLDWSVRREHLSYRILLLGLCALAGIAIGKKEDERKAKRSYRQQLSAGYPQMLSQLALLIASGMTVSHAWERIVLNYEQKKQNGGAHMHTEPVYEEMCMTYHQIRDGLGERLAYEQFGERLQLTVYRRFSTLLVQNLRKGTAGLSQLLDKEMEQAFEEQMSLSKKRGEELQTRLLLPMMLMLGLVIVIIMIPAMMSFQIG